MPMAGMIKEASPVYTGQSPGPNRPEAHFDARFCTDSLLRQKTRLMRLYNLPLKNFWALHTTF